MFRTKDSQATEPWRDSDTSSSEGNALGVGGDRRTSSDLRSSWDDDMESDMSSGEMTQLEKRVQTTEQSLSRKVDESVWEGRGPKRIRTWTTSAAFFSQPVLLNQFNLTPLVNQWYKDIIVIPHNAIKMELMDMYKMLRSFELFRRKIASADVARFFIWFELAEKFIVTFLDLDEELIMKPVDGVTTLPNILNKESRAEEKQAIRDTFAVINTYRVEAAVIKEDDSSFDHFLQSCRILGSRLVNYLSMKEKYIPQQIFRFSNEQETISMQNTMMMKLKRVPTDGDKFYVLYMRDLDVKTARAW
eukprot:CAMPEP_0113957822 /NCGR_PEP_ID=MMETSP0011_2-20120614/2993_1 /TAXON_ID=101924 /ORGANISM="Rhodosorus marinus" /LENGTH=302 /DNA_ID=CAMNT_0000968447 /DNA_START=140 /DNA_END=1045 /DNA_ORIENTATION=- /assembly_acc=CAM_ASM_000156